MHYSLTDAEKTYSGLTDGCAKAGRAGCKLIEFVGGNPTGNDVKTFVNYIHDVSDVPSGLNDQNDLFPPQLSLELYRRGIEVPLLPGFIKSVVF